MIPRIVHQTWRTDKLPVLFQKFQDNNKEVNKDLEFKLWNHENEDSDIDQLIKTEFAEIYHIYNKCKFGVQKADIARMAILYKYGGIYFDLDILGIRPIGELIDFDSTTPFLALEPDEQTMKVFNNKNLLCNAFIATPANNILFKLAIENVKKQYDKHGDSILDIFNFFGADLISNTLQVNKIECKYIKRRLIYPINDPKFTDLPSSKKDWKMLKNGNYGDSYMVHYWIHSDFESKIIIDKFSYNEAHSIHDNVFTFFKELYPSNVHLAD
jgi:hypothetical protein